MLRICGGYQRKRFHGAIRFMLSTELQSNAGGFNGDGGLEYNVTNMEGVFSSAFVFNGDVSGWDVSQVTNSIEVQLK